MKSAVEVNFFIQLIVNGYALHGSSGIAVITNPLLNGSWHWLGIPNPISEGNKLNNLLAERIFLKDI